MHRQVDLGRDGYRSGIILFIRYYPCSDVVFAESGSADDNNTLSVDRLEKSLSVLIAEWSTTLSNMHEVEGEDRTDSLVRWWAARRRATPISRCLGLPSLQGILSASPSGIKSSQLLGAPRSGETSAD